MGEGKDVLQEKSSLAQRGREDVAVLWLWKLQRILRD